jgi:putative phosphoribosyl transferase
VKPQFKKEHEIEIESGNLRLRGILAVPDQATAVVIFAHGSGSSRFSSRNSYVARVLQNHKIATFLMDLLTPEEAEDRGLVFDINLLAERLTIAKKWAKEYPLTKSLEIGFFGASTGAGAALVAAAQDPTDIFAVVSRGGRPDLAESFLKKVCAPTLLIIGSDDDVVIELNKKAFADLACEKELKIVAGATHLFEEPGKLEEVAQLAGAWFERHSCLTKREIASAKRGAHGKIASLLNGPS